MYYRPENHVLQIVAWDYLATNWVMWQGSLPQGSRRYYGPMEELMYDHWTVWPDKAKSIYKRVLKVVGRLDAATKYAFQSLRGKRQGAHAEK